MIIRVSGVDGVDGEVRGSRPGPGHRFFFSEDCLLVEYDGGGPYGQRAGSHSGFVTTVRIAGPNDRLYPPDSILSQHEEVYRFNTVPNTPLKQGQVTARGVSLGIFVGNQFTYIDIPRIFAITGGTEAYTTARGQIRVGGTKNKPDPADRMLDIKL